MLEIQLLAFQLAIKGIWQQERAKDQFVKRIFGNETPPQIFGCKKRIFPLEEVMLWDYLSEPKVILEQEQIAQEMFSMIFGNMIRLQIAGHRKQIFLAVRGLILMEDILLLETMVT